MAWRCHGRTNSDLINNLFRESLIKSTRVKDAMVAVDRAHYAQHLPYRDSPQSIGYSATISAPHMHALAAESLSPLLATDADATILDVGSGSGYLTHVLANLICGANGQGRGKVIGVDHIQELVDLSTHNMAKSEGGKHLLQSGKVEFIKADGRKGWKQGGPYDAIHVGAAAAEMHQDLIEQLKAPGRMFIPVEDDSGAMGQQWIWVVDKDEKGVVTKKKEMGVRYVPLTDEPTHHDDEG